MKVLLILKLYNSGLHVYIKYIYIFLSFRDRGEIFFKIVNFRHNFGGKIVLNQAEEIDRRTIHKKKKGKKRATIIARISAPIIAISQREREREKKIHFRRMRMVIRNHGDSISWLQEMERSSRVMRQSAFIIHRCGDGRRQIAGTKANVYAVFTSLHTWTRRRRETEESVRYQSAFFIQTFLFPKRKRRNADPASIAGFWIFISPREEYARNALASIGFRKLENKKNEACYGRIRKQGATL